MQWNITRTPWAAAPSLPIPIPPTPKKTLSPTRTWHCRLPHPQSTPEQTREKTPIIRWRAKLRLSMLTKLRLSMLYLWYDINHIYLVWYPLRFLHQYSIRPVTWCRPQLKRLLIWSSSSISSTSSFNAPENDVWIWWVGVHELVNGWVIGRHYTKYVSNCLLDTEIGRKGLLSFRN